MEVIKLIDHLFISASERANCATSFPHLSIIEEKMQWWLMLLKAKKINKIESLNHLQPCQRVVFKYLIQFIALMRFKDFVQRFSQKGWFNIISFTSNHCFKDLHSHSKGVHISVSVLLYMMLLHFGTVRK